MVDSGLAKTIQLAVYLANLVIFIGGLAVFSVGVWTLKEKFFLERLVGSNLYVASAAILIATGIAVAILSLLGTIGAYKEVKCMLLTFSIILLVIFVIMLIGGILGYIFRSEVDDRMYTEMLSSIKQYDQDTTIKDAWDSAHKFFKCCGISYNGQPGYDIWSRLNPRFRQQNNPRLPESCCRMDEERLRVACQARNPNERNAYTEGCYEKAKEFLKTHALIVGGIAIAIACLLVVGMVLSCALFLMVH